MGRPPKCIKCGVAHRYRIMVPVDDDNTRMIMWAFHCRARLVGRKICEQQLKIATDRYLISVEVDVIPQDPLNLIDFDNFFPDLHDLHD
jgi:hypothetical protein